jgi:prepilin-type N-terminal cleavage/methylation domain-containing protein
MRRIQAGFTLLEILIAMVILMVGLIGILAVFPTALKAANMAVQDTYAAAISRSVIDAIHLGLRASHARFDDGTSYFIFDHDGTTDPNDPDGLTQLERDRKNGMFNDFDLAVESNLQKIVDREYCILLPMANEVDGAGRPKAYFFPRQRPGDNRGRKGLEKMKTTRPKGNRDEEVEVDRDVRKIYWLGRKLGKGAGLSEGTREREEKDPYSQYGFAFTIRPAKGPSPTAPAQPPSVVEGLYEVIVKVYRNFDANPKNPRYDPIREFMTYVGE